MTNEEWASASSPNLTVRVYDPLSAPIIFYVGVAQIGKRLADGLHVTQIGGKGYTSWRKAGSWSHKLAGEVTQ